VETLEIDDREAVNAVREKRAKFGTIDDLRKDLLED
jgi:hypothetical protein